MVLPLRGSQRAGKRYNANGSLDTAFGTGAGPAQLRSEPLGIEILAAEPALIGLGREAEGDDMSLERPRERRRHLGGRAFGDRAGGEALEVGDRHGNGIG